MKRRPKRARTPSGVHGRELLLDSVCLIRRADAEYARLVDELVEAGLVERTEDGVKLTPEGEKVARQLALGADADALMGALLGRHRGRPAPVWDGPRSCTESRG
jgi:superfamily II helicase